MPTPDDRWFEAVARVDARDADLVADMLTDAGATGVSIEPAIHVQDNADFAYEELMDEPWTVRATFVEPFDEAEQAAVGNQDQALHLRKTFEQRGQCRL